MVSDPLDPPGTAIVLLAPEEERERERHECFSTLASGVRRSGGVGGYHASLALEVPSSTLGSNSPFGEFAVVHVEGGARVV